MGDLEGVLLAVRARAPKGAAREGGSKPKAKKPREPKAKKGAAAAAAAAAAGADSANADVKAVATAAEAFGSDGVVVVGGAAAGSDLPDAPQAGFGAGGSDAASASGAAGGSGGGGGGGAKRGRSGVVTDQSKRTPPKAPFSLGGIGEFAGMSLPFASPGTIIRPPSRTLSCSLAPLLSSLPSPAPSTSTSTSTSTSRTLCPHPHPSSCRRDERAAAGRLSWPRLTDEPTHAQSYHAG